MRNIYLLSIVLLLVGCSAAKNSLSITAANLPLEGRPLDRLDLVNMVDPENRRSRLANSYCREARQEDEFEATDFQCAIAAFDTYFMTYIEFEYYLSNFGLPHEDQEKYPALDVDGLPSGLLDKMQIRKAKSYALALRRNEIQDSVMRHSDEYCRRFQEDVSDTRSLFQMTTGSLATTLGGLGAIFTNAGAARALAGAAGITSGLNAEFESAFFQQQALSTIYAGIALRRSRLGEAIHFKRFREIDGKLITPQYEVVASFMRDGKIHEAGNSVVSIDVPAFAADLNYLYVVNFLETEPSAETPPADSQNDQTGNDAEPQDAKKDDPDQPKPKSDPKPKPVALVSVSSYSLERALGDAIIYHQACSLTEGLIEAERSIVSYQRIPRVRGAAGRKDALDQAIEERALMDQIGAGPPTK